jgi:GNAT superfamily N-acetyltransferase
MEETRAGSGERLGALSARLATESDLPALAALMEIAIAENLKPFLTPAQITASRAIMGLDSTLIADRTYFVIGASGQIAGCGGWSRRATMYGGDHTAGRDAALLDPATDAARVRAMYTHPAHVRRGVGSLVLDLCEAAAAAAGFRRLELAATLSGEPLYRRRGFIETGRFEDGGVPLVRMVKRIGAAPAA